MDMNARILKENDYSDIITVPATGVIHHGSEDEYLNFLEGDRRIDTMLIPEECINRRVRSLAAEIIRDNHGKAPLDLLVVATGAIIFASDLCREIYRQSGTHTTLHLIKTSVYDTSVKNSAEEYRAVKLLLEPGDVRDRNLIIVEDIIDQGFTLTWMTRYLKEERMAASARVCTLLNKTLADPTEKVRQLRLNLNIDYTGFIIEDRWVAGYGIDTADGFRNLPCIVTINEDYYR
jgi:hypoxanthine phosphoribosyltransferase